MRKSFLTGRRQLRDDLGDDPFAMLVNFFDCSIVFALGFMVAALVRSPVAPQTTSDATAAVDPGAARRAPLRPTADRATGPGERLGVAYKLPTGDIVYVPDGTGGK